MKEAQPLVQAKFQHQSSGCKAEALLASLVARTHELPSDRCVLDPDGEGRPFLFLWRTSSCPSTHAGIKLLPKGHQRAVWPVTGTDSLFLQAFGAHAS